MIDPLANARYYVRREVQDNNLELRLESREFKRIRRAQRKRDAVAWVSFIAVLALIIVADCVATGRW